MQQGIILNVVEWLALLAVLSLLVTIVKTLIGKQAKQLEQRLNDGTKKMEENEKRVEEIKSNYLSRFEEVKDSVNNSKIAILEAVNGIKVDMAQNYITKTECRFLQEKEGV